MDLLDKDILLFPLVFHTYNPKKILYLFTNFVFFSRPNVPEISLCLARHFGVRIGREERLKNKKFLHGKIQNT